MNATHVTEESVELSLLADAVGPQAAAKLLAAFDNLALLERATPSALASASGLSMAKVVALLAAMKLGRHACLQRWPVGAVFHKPEDVAKSFGPLLSSLPHEEFWAIPLTAKNARMGSYLVAKGSVTETSVSTREAFCDSLRIGAAGVLFLHNHPGGDPSPSDEDKALTQRLIAAGSLLDIPMIDHVILASGGFYSFSARS